MSDPSPVESPCIRVCAVDGKSGFCLGCFRTLKEIAGWGGLSNEEKLEVIQLADEHKSKKPAV